MTNYTGLRPRLAGLEDQLSDKFKASHHGFRMDITEEERFSLKPKLLELQNVLWCPHHGTIRWRNMILCCLVLELTNLQAFQEKASTNASYDLPSPSLYRPRSEYFQVWKRFRPKGKWSFRVQRRKIYFMNLCGLS